jgi:putative glycosyl hydrolase
MSPSITTMMRSMILAVMAFFILIGFLPVTNAQKRGLVYNDGVNINGFTAPGSKIGWLYNWDSATSTNYPQNWEYIPMLWGLQTDHLTVWPNRAPGHGRLFSFNEPERVEQSNLSPEQAADAYRQYMHPYGSAQLFSPAVSNDGYDWLQRFLQACSDCTIDTVAVH